ncbi:MAG: FecR family protein [Bacteroidales bacterium]|jgi:ferric-dicitrate binding protein FerR (iron transport regulator)
MNKNIDQYKIAELIFLELKDELSAAERDILDEWKRENPGNLDLYHKIVDENNIISKMNVYNKLDKKKAWTRLDKELEKNRETTGIRFKSVLRYAAAASILLLIGSYLLLKQLSPSQDEAPVRGAVILSGTQKATLTTSDNEKIELGRVEQSRVYHLANASVTDTNSTLTYLDKETDRTEKPSEVAVNTLETPTGGEYRLILSDGTKVFLNAETKLIFPEIFSKGTRAVKLEGEAYFEVAKSENKPFVIETPDYQIKVYGTSFNVSAYSSDKISRTTLVEGNVVINDNTGYEVRLSPGEQVCFDKEDNSLKTRKVDTHIYTSWKEGKFMFDNETLGEIMIKLERWYDVETYYLNEEIRNRHFSGTLDRYNEISDILNKIALTTRIEFNIKGNTIYVNKRKNK